MFWYMRSFKYNIALMQCKMCHLFTFMHTCFKYKWLCIKPGIHGILRECTEHGEWGEYFIPGNVAEHSGEYLQTLNA